MYGPFGGYSLWPSKDAQLGLNWGCVGGCLATQMPCNSNHSLPISAYNSTKSLPRSVLFTVMWKQKLNTGVGSVLCKNVLCLKLGALGWGWCTDLLIITVSYDEHEGWYAYLKILGTSLFRLSWYEKLHTCSAQNSAQWVLLSMVMMETRLSA